MARAQSQFMRILRCYWGYIPALAELLQRQHGELGRSAMGLCAVYC
jgi:hypothetical protein